jgi:hypothetical protein
MGPPTTWRDSSLSSPAWNKLNLWLGRVRTASDRSPSTASGHRAHTGSRRLAGGVRVVPPRVGSIPPPLTIRFVTLRVSSDAHHPESLQFRWKSIFELRDFRPSRRWRARRTTRRVFAPFVQILGAQSLRHASSSEVDSPWEHQLRSVTTVGVQPHWKNRIDCGDVCKSNQSFFLPYHSVIGQSKTLAVWPVA